MSGRTSSLSSLRDVDFPSTNHVEQTRASENEVVALSEYEALHRRLEEMTDELAATRKALAAAHRKNTTLRKEIDDIYDRASDADTIRKILVFWKDTTGRDDRTRLDLTGDRAKRIRWALKFWEPREVCLMVLGVMRNRWYVDHGKTDWKHILKDEGTAEDFLRMGRV